MMPTIQPISILLVKAGDTAKEVIASVGDYDAWFRSAIGPDAAELAVVRPYLGELLPSPQRYQAVIMTGSPWSVIAHDPWMEAAAAFLRTAVESKVPVLGVCFGHQLLGYAFGSKVIRSPKGREMGTVHVRLTPDGERDPLFQGVSRDFAVQATHEDVIEALPPGAIPLASNDNTALQAFRIGETGRGVQFHPELSHEGLRRLAETRRSILDKEGVARGLPEGEGSRQVLASIRPTSDGVAILGNFVEWARQRSPVSTPLRSSPSPRAG
jgi:GMP synthase (glutamine-hydrolysing)